MHGQSIALESLMDRFRRRWSQRGLSELTLKHYANTFRLFNLFAGDRELTSRDLTTDLVAAFGAWLRGTPLDHPE
jgi:IS5 family transposase